MLSLRNVSIVARAAADGAGAPTSGDTGWLNPTTANDVGAFSDPTNGFAVDSNVAIDSIAADSTGTQLHLQGYENGDGDTIGDLIPEGKVIVGIELRITRRSEASDVLKDSDFHLEEEGNTLRSGNFADESEFLPSSLTGKTYGSPTLMPDGTTDFPTRAQAAHPNFGCRYAAHNYDAENGHSLEIDCMEMKLYWGTP